MHAMSTAPRKVWPALPHVSFGDRWNFGRAPEHIDTLCSCINKANWVYMWWSYEKKAQHERSRAEKTQGDEISHREAKIKEDLRKATERGLLGGINVGSDVADCYNSFFSLGCTMVITVFLSTPLHGALALSCCQSKQTTFSSS